MHRATTTLIVFAILSISFRCVSAQGPSTAVEAQQHVDRATILLRQGQLKGAEAEARQAVKLSPHSPAYLALLGAVLGMEQKLPESTAYLEKAVSLDPEDVRSRRNLASNEFQMGDFRTARGNLQQVLRAEPGEPTSVLLLGMVDEELKDYTQAVRLLSSVPQEVQKHPKAQVALARCYYHAGHRQGAQQVLEALENHSHSAESIFLGGQVADQAGDYELAERMFRSVWGTYSDKRELGYNLALAQYHAGQLTESQATLQSLLDAGNDTSDIEDLEAWCLFKHDQIKLAVAHMDRAIALAPSRESNYLDVGMMLLHARRYNGALVAARKAVQVGPSSYRAYRFLGLAQYKLGELKAARESYAHAVALRPDDRESLLGLASAEVDDGRIEEAQATFEKLIALFPDSANVYLQYGRMLLVYRSSDGGQTEARAVRLLKKARALDNSLAEAHYLLGNLALSKGQTIKALPELELAAKLDPKPSRIHYALARAYLRLGRRKDAAIEMRLFQQRKMEEKRGGSPLLPSGREQNTE